MLYHTMYEIADILEIAKSIKLFMKMKNMSFILQKKLNKLFDQPSISILFYLGQF